MTLPEIKARLNDLAEEKVRDFNLKLNKDSALPTLGVRLPALRKLAAEIAKDDPRGFLESCDFSSIELTMLYSYVLGRLKGEIGEALAYFDRVVPVIDNWANCDTHCQSFKQAAKHPEETWAFLQRYRDSKNPKGSQDPFTLRVLVVMMMCHFLTDAYIDGVFETLDSITCDHYYYRMGAAWCVATAMTKQREKTVAYMLNCKLDDWTYHKAVRKMLESYRISDEDKAVLRTLKPGERLKAGMLK